MSSVLEPAPVGFKPLIEDRIARFFDAECDRAAGYGPTFERMWRLAGDTVLGGKLVRPLLLLDTFEALAPAASAAETETAIDLAVALELLHFSFLLHDDIIDGDVLRRGKPNLIGALAHEARVGRAHADHALHYAHTGGILMGDLLLAASHQAFARADLPHAARLRLLDLLGHTVNESVAGEMTDVGLADGVLDPTLTTILAMTAHKTATYTFELPLRVAAVLTRADRTTEDRLGRIGRHLGLGFQLQDDLLSTFGDPRTHGKDDYSDLREGKQTAIIAHARQGDLWGQIEPLLGHADMTTAEAHALIQLLARSGAHTFVQQLVDDQFRAGADLVEARAPLLGAPVRRVLTDLLADLRGRRS